MRNDTQVISTRLRLAPGADELVAGFRRIRDELGVPLDFPPHVVREALTVAGRSPGEWFEDQNHPAPGFLTIDPPKSMDLDQAIAGTRTSDGFRIEYAIADLGHFVDPGGHLDAESRSRGKTLYFPDVAVPQYPRRLSEGAASLLPGKARPVILWSFDLDPAGNVLQTRVRRAVIRSDRRLTYEQAQGELDADNPPETLLTLRAVGRLRQSLEQVRGGVDLRLPDQQVKKTSTGFQLTFRTELPVERWNAQISLMTGMAAAGIMFAAGTGLVRTLPAPPNEIVQRLRLSARALGVHWSEGSTYQDFVRSLDPSRPKHAALLTSATALLRGASYGFFQGAAPPGMVHNAIGAPYAHVTAPLRRMADRLANELVLRLVEGGPLPDWLGQALQEAPQIMSRADHRAADLERRTVDYVEAELLRDRIGEEFDAVVVEIGKSWAMVQLTDPAVLARCEDGGLSLGAAARVKLQVADPDEGKVLFTQA